MRRWLPLPVLGILLLTGCIGSQTRAPVTHYGVSQGAGSAGVHTVIEGDTLYSISKRYKIAMRDIALSNRLGPSFRILAGQRLRLPPPQEYKVRAGDTLYTVSRIFGVTTSQIASLNGLQSPYVIYSGDVLRLPSSYNQVAQADVPEPSDRPVAVKPGQKPVKRTAKAKIKKKPKITTSTPKRASSKFKKPVEGKIISGYGPKKSGQHNDGINIKAPKGAPIRAADNGVVVYAGNELKGSGNLVLVRHEKRWMTAYAHMDKILIKRGAVVKRGQSIGTVGSTGSVSSPQLHFEVRRGTEAINPKRYLE